MPMHTIQWKSRQIGKDTTMRVWVPDGAPPYATIYLLHGLGGDSSTWMRFHRLERLLEGRGQPLVVMPDADRSFYANDPRSGGLAYEDYVASEVREYVEQVFPVLHERRSRACVGLSMGGYGALLLALDHADLFGVAASISGSTYFGHDMTGRHEDDDVGMLGRALVRECNDLFSLSAGLEQAPALRISCGRQDHLYDTNLAFHQHLTERRVPHLWVEHEGDHSYATWDMQVPLAIEWAIGQMGAS